MAVSTTTAVIEYTATEGQTVFSVPFPFGTGADLVVYLITGSTPTLQTISTHYTVAGGSGSVGTVTMVSGVTAGVRVLIARSTALTQSVNLRDPGKFPASTVEGSLDRLTYIVQEIAARIGGAGFDLGAITGTMKIDAADLSRFDALGKRIGELAAPSAGSDAATKDYADSLAMIAGNLPLPGALQEGFGLIAVEDLLSETGYRFAITELDLSHISDAGTAASRDTGTTNGTVPLLGAGGKLGIGLVPTGTAEDTVPILGAGGLLAASTIPAASEAEVVTGTDTQKPLTPGRVANHPLTPAAWGVLNQIGTQALVGQSGGITISDTGTGSTRVTLPNAMASAVYAVLVTGPDSTIVGAELVSATQFDIKARTGANVTVDKDGLMFVVVGARAAS
jgi:hypothetical protein